jgi:hypothetical protein
MNEIAVEPSDYYVDIPFRPAAASKGLAPEIVTAIGLGLLQLTSEFAEGVQRRASEPPLVWNSRGLSEGTRSETERLAGWRKTP